MDLFLANLVAIIFLVAVFWTVKKSNIIKPQPTYFKALSIFIFMFLLLIIASAIYALTIGFFLPEIYVSTFFYKSIFIIFLTTVYWFSVIIKTQRAANRNKISV